MITKHLLPNLLCQSVLRLIPFPSAGQFILILLIASMLIDVAILI